MSDHPEILPEERSIWEQRGTIRVIWVTLLIGCIGFVAAGVYLASIGKLVYKPHFEDKSGFLGTLGAIADTFPAFYAVVGFLSFSFIVLAGQHLRKILMRREDYYVSGPDLQSMRDKVRVEDMDVGDGR